MEVASTGLRFITGYKYAKDMLQTINGLTFLYNPVWEYGADTQFTFPIAFFHLKGIHEVMESEVQTKKMIFYNSQATPNADGTKGSLVNMVADNIVNKPKTYKLDVIVPYEDLTMLFNSTAMSNYQNLNVVSFLSEGALTSNKELNFMNVSAKYLEIIKGLLNTLLNVGGASVTDYLTSVFKTPSYNKDSLEQMWRNRTVLKLKLWNGWKFKYVVITGFDITKEATEYGVEEATITCQELPVTVIRPKGEALKRKKVMFPAVHLAAKGIQAVADKISKGASTEE